MIYADLKLVLHDSGDVLTIVTQPARSFIRNFMRDLYAGFAGRNIQRFDINGSSRDSLYSYPYRVEGGFGFRHGSGVGGGSGIVLGSDGTPFSVADNNLKSTIGHGNGNGQLHRSAFAIGEPTIAPDEQSISMTFTRVFANNSGLDVMVREVGLIGRPWWGYGDDRCAYHLFARDVLESAITIEPGRQLTVDYVIKTVL